jgi:hypothetical protein
VAKSTKRVKRAARIPKGQRIDVTRAEFNRIIDLLNERGDILNGLRHNQDVQFHRIAQLQAELDQLKRAWERLNLS